MVLRPYQQAAIDAVLKAYDAGTRRMLLVSATGTGKTVIFSELYKQMQSRLSGQMLVLAHTEELIEQNRATLQANNPNTSVEV